MSDDSSLVNVHLVIRYEGLKSTQYFSKFTAESVAELRKDLIEIGLPHPKRENIQLLSHGTVECLWQTSPNNHILLNNLKMKTKPTPENMEKCKELSIANISWKGSPVGNSQPQNKKRPYTHYQSDQNTKNGHVTSSSPSLKSRIEETPDSGRNRGYQQRYSNNSHDVSMSDSNSIELHGRKRWQGGSSSASTDNQDRPSKIQKVNSNGFQLPAKPSFAERAPGELSRSRNSSFSAASSSGRRQSLSLQQRTEGFSHPAPADVDVKAEDRVVDDFLKNLPFEPTTRSERASDSYGGRSAGLKAEPASPSQTDVKNILGRISSNGATHPAAEYDSSRTGFGKIHGTRSLSGGPATGRPNDAKSDPQEIIDVDGFDIPGLNFGQGQREPPQRSVESVLPTPPASAEPLTSSAHSILNGFSKINTRPPPTGPRPLLRTDNGTPRVDNSSTKGSFSSPFATPSGPSYSKSLLRNRPRSAEPNGRSRTPPRSTTFSSDARSSRYPPSSGSDDTRRLMRESFDLKREIQALAAKYTTVTKQLQSLDGNWVPEPLQLGPDTPPVTNGNNKDRDDRLLTGLRLQVEDLERDLKREKMGRADDWKVVEFERTLKHEITNKLGEERKLKEEAEKALEDVRRECRHPFIVPTLLDAFVQVSKLTTRGLKELPPAPVASSAATGFLNSNAQFEPNHNARRDNHLNSDRLGNHGSASDIGIGHVDRHDTETPLSLAGARHASDPPSGSARPGVASSNGPSFVRGLPHTRNTSHPNSFSQPYSHGRNASGSFRDKDHDRRPPYNSYNRDDRDREDRREPSSSARHAMPPPRATSPMARSLNRHQDFQGKGKERYGGPRPAIQGRRPLTPEPYPHPASRRPPVKTEPRDESMF